MYDIPITRGYHSTSPAFRFSPPELKHRADHDVSGSWREDSAETLPWDGSTVVEHASLLKGRVSTGLQEQPDVGAMAAPPLGSFVL